MKSLPEPAHTIKIDIPTVTKRGLYISVLALLVLFPLHLFLNQPIEFTVSFVSVILFVLGYIILIVLHEFFHLFGFRVFANVPWKSMKVGMDLKAGIAYATTDKLMTNKAIRKALLLPFWMTGILPAIIGLYINSGLLIVLAALLIGGASGDFSMYKQLKRFPNSWVVQDDPELPRLYLFNPEHLAD